MGGPGSGRRKSTSGELDAGDVVWHITSDMSSFEKALKKSGNSAVRLGKQFGAVSKKISLGSAAIGVGMVGLVNKSQDFSKALADVNTLGIEDLDSLKQSIKSVNAEFAVGLVEGAEAAYQAISAGASEAETPLILERAAIAAKAGVSDLTTAIDFGTSVVNAFGLEMSDMNNVFDAAQVAIKLGKTNMQELGSTVGKLAPLFSSAGLSADEMLAGISALTSGGIATSEAVTGLKAVMQGILKPTSDATKIADELGIQFNLAGLKAKGFAGFMQDLAERTGGDTELLSGLFGSMEAGVAVMSLAGNQADVFAETIEAMANKADVSREAFDAWLAANPGFAFEQAMAKVENLATSLGDILAPAMIKLVDLVTPMIDWLSKWISENKKLGEEIGAAAVAIVAFGIGLAPVAVIVTGIVSVFGALASVVSGLTAPMIATAAVIAGVLVVAFLTLKPVMDSARMWINKNWESIMAVFGKAKTLLTTIITGLMAHFKIGFQLLGILLSGLSTSFSEAFGLIVKDSKSGSDGVFGATESILDTLIFFAKQASNVMANISNFLSNNWESIANGISFFANFVVKPIAFIISAFARLAGGVISFVANIVAAIGRLIAAIAKLPGNVGIPGFANGGEVPGFARGGKIEGFAHGGRTKHRIVRVGEQGPELAALPSGSQVMSNPDMMRAVSGASSGGGGVGSLVQNITIRVEGALNPEEIVDEIKAPLMKFLGTGLKEAMA